MQHNMHQVNAANFTLKKEALFSSPVVAVLAAGRILDTIWTFFPAEVWTLGCDKWERSAIIQCHPLVSSWRLVVLFSPRQFTYLILLQIILNIIFCYGLFWKLNTKKLVIRGICFSLWKLCAICESNCWFSEKSDMTHTVLNLSCLNYRKLY